MHTDWNRVEVCEGALTLRERIYRVTDFGREKLLAREQQKESDHG